MVSEVLLIAQFDQCGLLAPEGPSLIHALLSAECGGYRGVSTHPLLEGDVVHQLLPQRAVLSVVPTGGRPTQHVAHPQAPPLHTAQTQTAFHLGAEAAQLIPQARVQETHRLLVLGHNLTLHPESGMLIHWKVC